MNRLPSLTIKLRNGQTIDPKRGNASYATWNYAEAIKTGIAQRQAILGFIHAEAAGSARTGSEEDVPVDDFLFGNSLLFEGL